MAAAGRKDSETVKALVAAGAEVNAKDEDGRTALMEAADRDNSESVKILISAGAEVNAKDKEGRTALMRTHKPNCKKLLREAGASE